MKHLRCGNETRGGSDKGAELINWLGSPYTVHFKPHILFLYQ